LLLLQHDEVDSAFVRLDGDPRFIDYYERNLLNHRSHPWRNHGLVRHEIVTFAIVFGLSMDYEVFLVARVLEARRSGLGEAEAIPEGLARTAGLITSAASIMIVVFAAFTFGSFLVVKMIGFTLAVAVFIDATLVRIVIGPALLRIAGDWNWWPGGLATARREPLLSRK